MKVERGTRGKIEKFFSVNEKFTVNLKINGAAIYDFSCFGVDGNNKLSDDRYMIFYNQPQSPNNEIAYSEISNGANFSVNLNALPSTIQKLVFTASIDGEGTMGKISSHIFSIEQSGRESVTAEFSGKDFQDEKAITTIEIYRKDGWRFNVIARGFNGGLDALLKFYGGELAENISESEPQKISLEKKITENAPELISLVKPLKVALEKRNLLDTVAKVALVMDISGSMSRSYSNGTVQEIVNKILPIAVQFDDDGELDFWYFGDDFERRPSVNMKNYKKAVPRDWQNLMYRLGGGTDAAKVIEDVIDEYEGGDIPAYVIFITDGAIYSNAKAPIVRSSKMPIFWQFVGVGGNDYGLLEELDTMSGRYIDNANFFALDDFRGVDNSELYSRLLNEFPDWLKEAKRKGIF